MANQVPDGVEWYPATAVLGGQTPQGVVELDPDNQFDALLIEIKQMHDAKTEGYGSKRDDLQNFYDIAEQMGVSPLVACEFLLNKHQAALKKWYGIPARQRERTLYSNDAILDRAVYSVIALQLYRRGHS